MEGGGAGGGVRWICTLVREIEFFRSRKSTQSFTVTYSRFERQHLIASAS